MRILCGDERKCNFKNLTSSKVPNFNTTINDNKDYFIPIDQNNKYLN